MLGIYFYFGFLMPSYGIGWLFVQRAGYLGANGGTKGIFFDCCYMQQMFQSLA